MIILEFWKLIRRISGKFFSWNAGNRVISPANWNDLDLYRPLSFLPGTWMRLGLAARVRPSFWLSTSAWLTVTVGLQELTSGSITLPSRVSSLRSQTSSLPWVLATSSFAVPSGVMISHPCRMQHQFCPSIASPAWFAPCFHPSILRVATVGCVMS